MALLIQPGPGLQSSPTALPDTPAPLLQVRDLHIDFDFARPAVEKIDLEVHRGEILALVGESGSGKSMTARATLGLLPTGAKASGSIRVAGEEVLNADERTLNRIRGAKVALVFQEPQSALNPGRRVGWQLREALRAHRRIGHKEARSRAIELLRLVEIPEPARRVEAYPHQLSGGQKQRVAIALALANEPELLLADEPTTALDVTVQAEILGLLKRLRARTGMGVLLITHNLGIVAQHADRVVVLKSGAVVEQASTADLFARPQAAYTRQLLAAVPRIDREQAEPSVADTVPAERDTVLTVDELSVTFAGRRGRQDFRALNRVSLSVRPGEVLALVGESGSGKTTLGRVAAGLVEPTEGNVSLFGADLAGIGRGRLRELRRDLAFVHQDPAASLDPLLTIGATIREPLDLHRVGKPAERRTRVREMLTVVGLPEAYANRLPHQLSGGQRQRVALARALVLRPKLIIADEPTSALDVSVQAEVLTLFRRLQAELGFASIFISHDLAVVRDIADTVAVLQRGEIVERGPVRAVFTRPAHPYTAALLAAVPVPDPRARTQDDET